MVRKGRRCDVVTSRPHSLSHPARTDLSSHRSHVAASPHILKTDAWSEGGGGDPTARHSFLLPPATREDIGLMLDSVGGFEIGVELGVQKGEYAKQVSKNSARKQRRRLSMCLHSPQRLTWPFRFSHNGNLASDTTSLICGPPSQTTRTLQT